MPQSFTWWPAMVGLAMVATFVYYLAYVFAAQHQGESALWGVFGSFGTIGLLCLFLEWRRRTRRLVLVPTPRGMAVYRSGALVHELHSGEMLRMSFDLFRTAFFLLIGLALIGGACVMPFSKGDLTDHLLAGGLLFLLGLALAQGAWARLLWVHLELPVEKGRTAGVWIPRSAYKRHWA